MMLLKYCTKYASKFGKLNSGQRTGKGQFSFKYQIGQSKECSYYCTIGLISHANKVMLKIFQARLQQYKNQELPNVPAGFRKGRRIRDQIGNIHWIIEKQGDSRKTSTSASLETLKPLTVWITTNWKILKEMGIPDHLTCLLRNLYARQEAMIRTGHGKMDWFKIGKGYIKAAYCHPAYLTSMQSTSCTMLDWTNHKLESRLSGEVSKTSDMQMMPL